MDNQEQQVSPELQGLFAEAMFWKNQYLQERQNNSQIIAMLSRPAASPEQLANVLQLHPDADGENAAQEPAQPQQQPNRAARRRKTTG